MATITERFDSGEGDREGVGGLKASRRFDVHLDEEAGDDINNPIAPLKDAYPLGSQHNVASGLYATDHIKVERVKDTRGRWICEILYDVPLVPQSGDYLGWTIDFDHSLQMEEMTRDLDGKLVGGNAYRFPENGDTAGYRAQTIDGMKALVQRPGAITPARLMRFVPSFTIRATRSVGIVTRDQYSQGRAYRNRVNSITFLAHGAGTVLAAAPRVSRRPGTLPNEFNQRIPGIVYDVELNFLGNDEGWEIERLYDRFEHKGYEGQVELTDGTPVFRDFRKYETADLEGLLRLFGGSVSRLPAA